MVMQIRRTLTADAAPSGLAEGQLACELASNPPKLWVGVPTALDASGRRLVVPSSNPVATGPVPPVSPVVGDLWFDPVEGQLYIYFNDGTSSQWVVTINQGGGGGGGPSGPQAGVTNGSNAAPGEIGEYLVDSQFNATTSGPAAVAVVMLGVTPGDWDVQFSGTVYLFQDSGGGALTRTMGGAQMFIDSTAIVQCNLDVAAGIAVFGMARVPVSMQARVSTSVAAGVSVYPTGNTTEQLFSSYHISARRIR